MQGVRRWREAAWFGDLGAPKLQWSKLMACEWHSSSYKVILKWPIWEKLSEVRCLQNKSEGMFRTTLTCEHWQSTSWTSSYFLWPWFVFALLPTRNMRNTHLCQVVWFFLIPDCRTLWATRLKTNWMWGDVLINVGPLQHSWTLSFTVLLNETGVVYLPLLQHTKCQSMWPPAVHYSHMWLLNILLPVRFSTSSQQCWVFGGVQSTL